jgi:hypothetical protein
MASKRAKTVLRDLVGYICTSANSIKFISIHSDQHFFLSVSSSSSVRYRLARENFSLEAAHFFIVLLFINITFLRSPMNREGNLYYCSFSLMAHETVVQRFASAPSASETRKENFFTHSAHGIFGILKNDPVRMANFQLNSNKAFTKHLSVLLMPSKGA